jgi:hypothetical protein
MTTNGLDDFIKGIKRVWGALSSETVESCQRLLEQLAKSPATKPWLAEFLKSGVVEKELYRDPEHGFLLLAYLESEGQYRVPHDHGSGWVIYAVCTGEMEMATYHRAVSQTGRMYLVRRESYRVRPGDCRVYLPGDIHDTRCISKSVLMLRFTSCDLQKEGREGRMIKYRD